MKNLRAKEGPVESGELCFVSTFLNLITNIEKADWFVSMPLKRRVCRANTQNVETGQRDTEHLFSADLGIV